MMDKAKHKEQPINTRKYWIGFSILLGFLLIPLRFTIYIYSGQEINVSSWDRSFTVIMYGSLTAVIAIFLLWFVLKHKLIQYGGLKLIAIICLCLSISQTTSNIRSHRWHCLQSGYVPTYGIGAVEWDGAVLEPIWCSPHVFGACCYTEYIKIKYIPIVVHSRWINMWSPNTGLRQDW